MTCSSVSSPSCSTSPEARDMSGDDKKNSMIVRMWIWSHISSSAFAWSGMMEGQSPFPSPDLLRRRGWVFYHAQMNLIYISLLILHLILTQVKQLNPKIPPASAPHPEPSEYMCLVRFCGIAWPWSLMCVSGLSSKMRRSPQWSIPRRSEILLRSG